MSTGRPEIFNTDQGSQFTDDDFTGVLRDHGVAISMDGRGRFSDNIFVERLWRSLKYEEVYLKAYASGLALERPGDPNRCGAVAQVPLQLAFDATTRVGRELVGTGWIASVDCLDERERRYLSEVVPPFGSGEAPRHALGQRQVPLDQA